MTPARADNPGPTARQLTYLKALAIRAGQSFEWPQTRSQASREIRRLNAVAPTHDLPTESDLAAERAARQANNDVPVRPFEVAGFGSTATWSQRS
jgi:hypothetical protein